MEDQRARVAAAAAEASWTPMPLWPPRCRLAACPGDGSPGTLSGIANRLASPPSRNQAHVCGWPDSSSERNSSADRPRIRWCAKCLLIVTRDDNSGNVI